MEIFFNFFTFFGIFCGIDDALCEMVNKFFSDKVIHKE